MYRIFNIAVDCEFPLPELPRLDDADELPVYKVRTAAGNGGSDPSGDIDWFHDWRDSKGSVTIRAGRRARQIWLRFPGLADFEIDLAARRVIVHAPSDIESSTIRHLLLDQVIPRVLGQEGNLVLHAGAVQLPGGRALAFVGQTGFGKSTLVSTFEKNGARLVTDDCLMIGLRDKQAYAIPNYAGVRLFDDSIEAIYGARAVVADVAHYTSKRRVVLADTGAVPVVNHVTLDDLFLIGDPADAGDEISLSPAAGAGALMQLVEQTFVLDSTDTAIMGRLFGISGTLLREHCACYALNYPRDHSRLGEVRETIQRVVE